MKRVINFIMSISFIFCISLFMAPEKVEAKDTKVASGAWITGTEVEVDALVPADLNLLTKGVKIAKPGLICHPFSGGQFHWVGEIRQLKNGEWQKLDTTNDWYPDKEGQFMSCSQAPAAGTYALFGYYNGPLEIAYDDMPGICSSYAVNTDGFTNIRYISSNSAGLESTSLMVAAVHFTPEVPAGTLVSYTVSSTSPGFIGGGTRSHDPIAATDIGLGISGYVNYVDESGSHWIRANVTDIGVFDFVFHIEGCGDVPYHVSLPRQTGH